MESEEKLDEFIQVSQSFKWMNFYVITLKVKDDKL